MKQKEGFTLEEHKEFGKRLQQAKEVIRFLVQSFYSRYGKSKPPYKRLNRAMLSIDVSRGWLDNCVDREFPNTDNCLKRSLYYGGTSGNNADILCPHYDMPTAHCDENKNND